MNGTNGPIDILLVEDNPTDAELCIRSLKKHNLANNLVWVKDGAEALDFLWCRGEFAGRRDTQRPRLILLDLKLPKVGGLEVLRQLKADETLKNIPVVVLTSSQEDRDLAECYSLGANGYVTKPVEFSDFSDAVIKLGLFWLLVNKVPY
jgi:two-component system, response regulator